MDRERPSAQELCHHLAALKDTHQYGESVQQATSEGKDRQISELQRDKAELLEQCTQHVQQQEQHTQQIRDLQQQVQTQSDCLQARENELTQQIDSLQLQFQENNHEMERRVQELNAQVQSHELITAEFQQNLLGKEETIRELQQALTVRRDSQIQHLQVDETQATAEGSGSVSVHIRQSQQTQTATHQLTEPKTSCLSKVDVVRNFQLLWRDGGRAAFKGATGSVAVHGNISYFSAVSGEFLEIYGYNTGKWLRLPKCGRWQFALAVINSLLTLIGGLKSGKHGVVHCDSLLSLTGEGQDKKWVEHFPPMPIKRSQPAVVCNGKSLVVAGGDGDDYGTLNTVEVMDTETLQWSSASSLPGDNSSCRTGFATICGDQIYVRCGKRVQWTHEIVTCSLTDLLQSCQSTPQSPQSQSRSLGAQLEQRKENEHVNVWRKTAELSYECSTITSMCGQLLAVGGVDPTEQDFHARKPTDSIHRYNPATDSWEVISHMPTARCDCLVAVLPSNELMVVGGRIHGAYGDCTDVVEIGTLV